MLKPSVGRRSIAPVDGLSHVEGCTARPLIDATLRRSSPRWYAATASVPQRYSGPPAIAGHMSSWRVGWIVRAAGLLSLGLYKGERIGIWAPNRPEWLIAQFATARIGLVLVNINPAYRTAELEYALNRVGAKALIAARQFKSSAYVEMIREMPRSSIGASPAICTPNDWRPCAR